MHVDVVAQPGGGPTPFDLAITNRSDAPRTIRFYVETFSVGLNGELVLESTPDLHGMSLEQFERWTAAPYIRTETPVVELDPTESRSVRFLVDLPSGSGGEYFALVRMNPGVSPTGSQESARGRILVNVTLQLGVYVFVTAGTRLPTDVDGRDLNLRVLRVPPARFDVEVASLHAEFPDADDKRQTVKVVATVENRGNVHFHAKPSGIVRNLDTRRTVGRIQFSGGLGVVFPESARRYIGEIASPLPPGLYQLHFHIDGDDPRLHDSLVTNFQVMERVAGAMPTPVTPLGVLSVDASDVRIRGPGGASHRFHIYNTGAQDLEVTVRRSGASADERWLAVYPRKLRIPVGGSGAIRLRTRAPGDVDGPYEQEFVLVPAALDGAEVGEAGNLRIRVVWDREGD